MFKNAKIGDRVWDYLIGWGTIVDIDKDYNFPILVEFNNGEKNNYRNDGKNIGLDLNPTLFWDEIKFEIPEKPFNLEEELKKMEVIDFNYTYKSYFLYWNNSDNKIAAGYETKLENPMLIYFYKETVETFLDNIKDKNITKEQFFKAYKNAFGGK